MTHDVVIIGGGAAGLTAAMYLRRAEMSVAVIDQDRSILKRALLNNMPAQEGVEGSDFLADLREQVDGLGADRREGKVTDVVPGDGSFTVSVDGEGDLTCTYVVLATGQGNLRLASLDVATEEARQPFVKVNVVTDRWGLTSIPNVWACGVVAGWPSQTVACAGSGAAVAVEIVSAARGEFYVDHDDTATGASE